MPVNTWDIMETTIPIEHQYLEQKTIVNQKQVD